MNPPENEAMWRNRFILINLTRIGGTFLVLFALVAWQGDLIVEGGHPIFFLFVLIGLVISFGGPLLLARRWRTPPDA